MSFDHIPSDAFAKAFTTLTCRAVVHYLFNYFGRFALTYTFPSISSAAQFIPSFQLLHVCWLEREQSIAKRTWTLLSRDGPGKETFVIEASNLVVEWLMLTWYVLMSAILCYGGTLLFYSVVCILLAIQLSQLIRINSGSDEPRIAYKNDFILIISLPVLLEVFWNLILGTYWMVSNSTLNQRIKSECEHITAKHPGKLSKEAAQILQIERSIYVYDDFANPSRELRLIELVKSGPFSKVACSILSFHVDDAPDYEAISYTWNGQLEDHFLELNGARWLLVTENVYNIIHELSTYRKVRYLWIDAVCINQRNGDEKGKQLKIMGDIYRNAERVIVWLGNDGPEPAEIMYMLVLLEQICHFVLKYRECRRSLELQQEPLGSRYSWKALARFLSHKYWSRVWIIQEIANGKKVHIFYGGRYLAWDHILTRLHFRSEALKSIFRRELCLNGFMGIEFCGRKMEQMATILECRLARNQNRFLELRDCLRMTRSFEATDDRDKVYALYGLIGTLEQLPVNYRTTKEDLYTTVTIQMLRRCPTPVLEFAGIGYRHSVATLASWTPDWASFPMRQYENEAVYLSHNRRYRAGGLGRLQLLSLTQSLMTLACIPVSQVQHLAEPFETRTILDDFHHTGQLNLRQLGNMLHFDRVIQCAHNSPRTYARTGQPRHEALWRTLLGDRVLSEKEEYMRYISPAPPEYGSSFRSICRGFGMLENLSRNFPPVFQDLLDNQRATLFFRNLFNACALRRFAVAEDGSMLLVPHLAERGDLLCVVRGMPMPILLRPKGSEGRSKRDEKQWSFVGDCYVHGVMGGELLDGTAEELVFPIE